MLAEEYKGSKITVIEWWYVGLRQHITFPDLKDLSRLQFTRLLEESKYHYKYFGDNQTDKQSVVTILNYVETLRRDKHRIQNLRSPTPFAVITAGVKGQKNNSFFSKLVNNTYTQFHFVLFHILQRIWKKLFLSGTSKCLWCNLICWDKHPWTFPVICFTTVKDVGCLQGVPENDAKLSPWPRWMMLHPLCHDSLCVKHRLSQSSNYAVNISFFR